MSAAEPGFRGPPPVFGDSGRTTTSCALRTKMDTPLKKMPTPIHIIASPDAWIEGAAVQQLKRSAQLAGMLLAVGMPDLHPGKGHPVGAVFASAGMLHPLLVGNDIGCGMGLWQTDIPKRKIKLDRWERKLRGLDDSWEGDTVAWLRERGLELDGPGAVALARSWKGTVLWTCRSPYRPTHKRKNWFVGVEVFEPPEEREIDAHDLKVETLRASGPGGQNVNRRESAVRVTHLPTGVSVLAREERSQHQNTRLAMARLAAALKEHEQMATDATTRDRRDQHDALERGNPVRSFRGPGFERV